MFVDESDPATCQGAPALTAPGTYKLFGLAREHFERMPDEYLPVPEARELLRGLVEAAKEQGIKGKSIYHPLRVALSGREEGPGTLLPGRRPGEEPRSLVGWKQPLLCGPLGRPHPLGDLSMRLYDSMSQEKKEFVPRDGDHVTMYFCGPTVYNYVHVGNARPYVVSMVAKRYFESLGYRVTLVENITDIDDRIIQKGIARAAAIGEVAEEFATAYRDDTDRLGLGRPDVEPLATEHIQEIVDLIAELVARGHAYQAGPTSTSTWTARPAYGKLSKQQVAEMRHGARIDVGEDKADPLDFALWKGAKPGEPAWDSPWGPGRPGWHIECSAMSLKYLGVGVRHPRWRSGPHLPPPRERDRPGRGGAGRAVRALLDAQRHAQPEPRRRCPRAWATSSPCATSWTRTGPRR